MLRFIAGLFACLAFALPAPGDAQSATAAQFYRTQAIASVGVLHEYRTETAAQRHCPSDEIVWLNTRTGIWHEKGMRWYANTRSGAYVCRREAAAVGGRDTLNGQ